MPKVIPERERLFICGLLAQGRDVAAIARITGRDIRTIMKWRDRINSGTISEKKRTGKKKSLSQEHEMQLVNCARENPTFSSTDLLYALINGNGNFPHISRATLYKAIKKHGLILPKSANKPVAMRKKLPPKPARGAKLKSTESISNSSLIK